MPLEKLFDDLAKDLPVLFAYVGWAEKYDGTERIVGNHRALASSDPAEVMEAEAFIPGSGGTFRCGIGRGRVGGVPRFHVVSMALRVRCRNGVNSCTPQDFFCISRFVD